jgi:hypothetical protein
MHNNFIGEVLVASRERLSGLLQPGQYSSLFTARKFANLVAFGNLFGNLSATKELCPGILLVLSLQEIK